MSRLFEESRIRFDVLRVPLLGRFLLWKHGRTAMQSVVFLLAASIIVDGLAGTQLAAKNVATVSAWVHYRGLVVFALLVAGNLFCAACPFMLSRKFAKWVGKPTRRWPKALRNKWLALFCLVAIIYLYELFDLWASPWWTAWLAVAYFAAAFVLGIFFTRDSFCLYVCPLGSFNFLYSTVSPLQITARSQRVCRDCIGHECINGSATQHGCQLELFVPTMSSNMNCTFCLDCAKACPHDNVALGGRPSGDELFRQSWPNRLDLAMLAIVAAFVGLVNAFAMTPPVYMLEVRLAALLNTRQEALVLAAVYAVGAMLAPLALVFGAAWLSRRLTHQSAHLSRIVTRYAYGFVPLGFAIWIAHYGFHFATGAMTIVPAYQTFFAQTLGWALFGEANWELARLFIPRVSVIQFLQICCVYVGFLAALALVLNGARRQHTARRSILLGALPWIAILLLLALLSGATFLLPMEMRGSALGG